jgi:hypothetical protein
LQSTCQVDMKNDVECCKDLFGYFYTLETVSMLCSGKSQEYTILLYFGLIERGNKITGTFWFRQAKWQSKQMRRSLQNYFYKSRVQALPVPIYCYSDIFQLLAYLKTNKWQKPAPSSQLLRICLKCTWARPLICLWMETGVYLIIISNLLVLIMSDTASSIFR